MHKGVSVSDWTIRNSTQRLKSDSMQYITKARGVQKLFSTRVVANILNTFSTTGVFCSPSSDCDLICVIFLLLMCPAHVDFIHLFQPSNVPIISSRFESPAALPRPLSSFLLFLSRPTSPAKRGRSSRADRRPLAAPTLSRSQYISVKANLWRRVMI